MAAMDGTIQVIDPKTGDQKTLYLNPALVSYVQTQVIVLMGVFFLLNILFAFLIWKKRITWQEGQSFLIYILVVFSGMWVIIAGYDEKQSAPMFAMLTAILGFAFGRSTAKTGKSQEPAVGPD